MRYSWLLRPGQTGITFCALNERVQVGIEACIVVPNGTGLNPGCAAASADRAKSIPAAANKARAASFCSQPSTAARLAYPSAAGSSNCAPLQVDCTAFQPNPQALESRIISTPCAP